MFTVDALPKRLQIRTMVDAVTGCWIWTGKATAKGYGMVKRERSRQHVMVYRLSYELLVGPISDGLVIDHLCRNPRCLNPTHLEPVTQAENLRRGTNQTNDQRVRTHCPLGHPLAGDNLYLQVRNGSTHRSCVTCRRDYDRRRRLS